jgi:hypothetical protein
MKRIINLIGIIPISGMLLIGCGNTDIKKDDTSSLTNTSTENTNSDEQYKISSTTSGNGKPVKEEKGTVLENKDGIKTKIADADGNLLDKDLDTKLRQMCEKLSEICESKDIEGRLFKEKEITFVLMGDIPSITSRKQQLIDYLKKNPMEGYKQNIMIASRTESGGETFEVK